MGGRWRVRLRGEGQHINRESVHLLRRPKLPAETLVVLWAKMGRVRAHLRAVCCAQQKQNGGTRYFGFDYRRSRKARTANPRNGGIETGSSM